MSAEPDVLTVLRETNPDAARLAELVAVASRVEPELLRSVRLRFLPTSHASAEADLWFSALVSTRTYSGIVLDPEWAEIVWRRASDDRCLDEAAAHIADFHLRSGAPAIALEERVRTASLRGTPEAAQAIDAELRGVLRAMTESPHARMVARWAGSALPRLPRAVRETEAGRLLAVAVALLSDGRSLFDEGPRGALPDEARSLLQTLPSTPVEDVRVGLRRTSDGIEFHASAEDAAAILTLPSTRPPLVEVAWKKPSGEVEMRLVAAEPGRRVEVEAGVSELRLRTLRGERFTFAQVRTEAASNTAGGAVEPLRLSDAIGFVQWNGESGIAYFVAPDRLATSARLLGGASVLSLVRVQVQEQVLDASVLAIDLERDCAVLGLETSWEGAQVLVGSRLDEAANPTLPPISFVPAPGTPMVTISRRGPVVPDLRRGNLFLTAVSIGPVPENADALSGSADVPWAIQQGENLLPGAPVLGGKGFVGHRCHGPEAQICPAEEVREMLRVVSGGSDADKAMRALRRPQAEQIAAFLENVGWVAVVGPHGVGKSALINSAARTWRVRRAESRRQVLWVDLHDRKTSWREQLDRARALPRGVWENLLVVVQGLSVPRDADALQRLSGLRVLVPLQAREDVAVLGDSTASIRTVIVNDLALEQVQSLASAYRVSLLGADLDRVMTELGGNPRLLHFAFLGLSQKRITVSELFDRAGAAFDEVFGAELQWLRARVSEDKGLVRALQMVARVSSGARDFESDRASIVQLRRLGIIASDEPPRLRSRIYRDVVPNRETVWTEEVFANGRVLTAMILRRGDVWFELRFLVRAAHGAAPLEGNVTFQLHETFIPNTRTVLVEGGVATLVENAYGAFEVKATADDGRTRLVLDLATVPGVPVDFKFDGQPPAGMRAQAEREREQLRRRKSQDDAWPGPVFLSFVRSDPEAAALRSMLAAEGVPVESDENIVGGEASRSGLVRMIDRAVAAVVLISRGASESGWMMFEYSLLRRRGIPLLPFRLGDAEVPSGLDRVQYRILADPFDAERGAAEIIADLRRALDYTRRTRANDSRVVVVYSARETKLARALQSGLRAEGLDTQDGLRHLANLAGELEQSASLVVIASGRANESPFVREATAAATRVGCPVVALRLGEAELVQAPDAYLGLVVDDQSERGIRSLAGEVARAVRERGGRPVEAPPVTPEFLSVHSTRLESLLAEQLIDIELRVQSGAVARTARLKSWRRLAASSFSVDADRRIEAVVRLKDAELEAELPRGVGSGFQQDDGLEYASVHRTFGGNTADVRGDLEVNVGLRVMLELSLRGDVRVAGINIVDHGPASVSRRSGEHA